MEIIWLVTLVEVLEIIPTFTPCYHTLLVEPPDISTIGVNVEYFIMPI